MTEINIEVENFVPNNTIPIEPDEFISQAEISRRTNVSRARVSKKLQNEIHRAKVRINEKGLVSWEDYKKLTRLTSGPKKKDALI